MYVYTSQVLCRNMYSLIKVLVILLNDLFIITDCVKYSMVITA